MVVVVRHHPCWRKFSGSKTGHDTFLCHLLSRNARREHEKSDKGDELWKCISLCAIPKENTGGNKGRCR